VLRGLRLEERDGEVVARRFVGAVLDPDGPKKDQMPLIEAEKLAVAGRSDRYRRIRRDVLQSYLHVHPGRTVLVSSMLLEHGDLTQRLPRPYLAVACRAERAFSRLTQGSPFL
jgi:hypothetical protein